VHQKYAVLFETRIQKPWWSGHKASRVISVAFFGLYDSNDILDWHKSPCHDASGFCRILSPICWFTGPENVSTDQLGWASDTDEAVWLDTLGSIFGAEINDITRLQKSTTRILIQRVNEGNISLYLRVCDHGRRMARSIKPTTI
jgi:hypothetical protein